MGVTGVPLLGTGAAETSPIGFVNEMDGRLLTRSMTS
jgi:hypothetical protein